MRDPSYWYDFKEERISGWTYLLRVFIGVILTVLIVPGPFLVSSTVYKRSGALEWPRNLRLASSIVIPLNFLFQVYGWFILNIVKPDFPIIFLFLGIMATIAISLLHFTLLFTDSRYIKSGHNPINKSSHRSSSYSFLAEVENEDERYRRLKKAIFEKYLPPIEHKLIENQIVDYKSETILYENEDSTQIEDIAPESIEPEVEQKISVKKSETRFDFRLSKGWTA